MPFEQCLLSGALICSRRRNWDLLINRYSGDGYFAMFVQTAIFSV
jgi:hypothetical protein